MSEGTAAGSGEGASGSGETKGESPGTEEQIRNAVAFLTHAKVRESTEASKRSFLESKGLSKEEIDEAFKRAGVASASAQEASSAPAAPAAAPRKQPAPAPAPQPVRWTQLVLGAGVLAGGAYLARKAFEGYGLPRFLQPDGAGDASAALAKSKREEDVDAMVTELRKETKDLKNSVDDLKHMFLDLEGSVTDYRTGGGTQEEVSELREELRTLTTTINQFASPEKQVAYEETLKDELSAIKSILSDIQTPQARYETPQSAATEEITPQIAGGAEAIGSSSGAAPGPRQGRLDDDDPPRPHSYMEILELLEKNQTPPGIRTDIDDKVKVPNQDPTRSSAEAPPKPWQRSGGGPGLGLGSTSSLGAVSSPSFGAGLDKGKRAVGSFGEASSSSTPKPALGDDDGVDVEFSDSTNGGWRPPPVPMSRLTSPISQVTATTSGVSE
ncbi:peroxisomal membrane protein Pex14 [Chloropicon primus]|uniref:Peroxisomal membrane protein PEX14 n=1 Tax=Chloropicon primus TaxID=1764295 RepID=A0A5B8MEF6_9CHLO|nr:peroxisomal membrane protein Pex14 [Chloropicon primus]|eukprot:QDZ17720.1 peroxisomal membrane protein Pex14 [Chloropicon primus]